MRIMLHSQEKDYDTVSKLEKELFLTVDLFDEFDLVDYCSGTRSYSYIFININNIDAPIISIERAAEQKNEDVKIFWYGTEITTKTKKLLSASKHTFVKKNMSIKDMDEIVRKMENKEIAVDGIKIDLESRSIFIKTEDKEEIQISFEKETNFYVFLYFIRNYKKKLSVAKILDAIVDEPEYAKNSIVESAITSLRKVFRENFGINPIKSFKKVGYRFSLTGD